MGGHEINVRNDLVIGINTKIGTPVADLATDIAGVNLLLTSALASGTKSYLDAGAEQTVFEIVTTKRLKINGLWLDLVNMTQNGIVKLYHKIDGVNYREFASYPFVVATDNDGVYISLNMGISYDFKVTYTEEADEGADRAIPYYASYNVRE